MASSTWDSEAMGERESLARDSEMRIMASSWRTVMGIEERALALSSAECTCRLMETKWEESFSAASGERRGAQRLGRGVRVRFDLMRRVVMRWEGGERTICNS